MIDPETARQAVQAWDALTDRLRHHTAEVPGIVTRRVMDESADAGDALAGLVAQLLDQLKETHKAYLRMLADELGAHQTHERYLDYDGHHREHPMPESVESTLNRWVQGVRAGHDEYHDAYHDIAPFVDEP